MAPTTSTPNPRRENWSMSIKIFEPTHHSVFDRVMGLGKLKISPNLCNFIGIEYICPQNYTHPLLLYGADAVKRVN